jgi:hypothetical protein
VSSASNYRFAIAAVPPILAAAAVLFAERIYGAVSVFIAPCPSYTLFSLYCPGCGNTRSLAALLRGDLLSALRYNPAIPFAALLAAAFYIELVFWAFGRKHMIVPRNKIFWFTTAALFLVYYVMRNLV